MTPSIYKFLSELKQNNNREWFAKNKERYEAAKNEVLTFSDAIFDELSKIDKLGKYRVYRIYRDVRFSSDKSPYKNHFGIFFPRRQPQNRGSFYVHLEPGNSIVGGGFWMPNKDDLQRIRAGIETEDDLRNILNHPKLKKEFGFLQGETVKTAPKGFSKNHPHIDLIRYKQFLLKKEFDDKTVFSPKFKDQIIDAYKLLKPFFLYMTDVLTTNANGEFIN
ncbi:MAG: DUF2461 domain-containing protein [Flavobacteriaceae bacterium]|nr:DUF2461 domain-containing protein [Flavobacteriaceae bacterium]